MLDSHTSTHCPHGLSWNAFCAECLYWSGAARPAPLDARIKDRFDHLEARIDALEFAQNGGR